MASRSRRANAGARMDRLLQAEDADEFYATTYGGFTDADGDGDYVQGAEGEDIIDSDFSIDEDDEPVSDHGDEDKKKPRKITRGYKEPVKKKVEIKTVSKSTPPPQKVKKAPAPTGNNAHVERKSIRKSTVDKSAETKQRIKIRNQLMKDKVKKSNVDDKMPTQEELLAEALKTEIDNVKSLERFERLEHEKKIIRPTKRAFSGPIIRYHSFTVNPSLVETVSDKLKKTAAKDKVDNKRPTDAMDIDIVKLESDIREKSSELTDVIKDEIINVDGANGDEKTDPRYERTLLTFLNDVNNKAFRKAFPVYKNPKRKIRICAITKQPAKYFDPVTNLPYSSIEAFKILREAYYQQLESRGNRNIPEVAKWVEWRISTWKSRKMQNLMKLA